MKISDKDVKKLMKSAQAVTEQLEKSTAEVRKLAELSSNQERRIEAQGYAISLVKEGMIDPDQIDEVIEQVMTHGLEIYKVASGMSYEAIPFGELSEESLVEKTASGPTYKGEPVNPVEATLLQFREQKYGIPSGLD